MSKQESQKKAESPQKTEDVGKQSPDELHSNRNELFSKARRKREEGLRRNAEELGIDPESEEAIRALRDGSLESRAEAKALAKKMVEQREGDDGEQDEPAGRGEQKQAKAKDDDVDHHTVDVVISGRSYKVPKADVDRAGGLEAYQKTRAADLRLQEAAAIEHQARLRQKQFEEQQRKQRDQEKQARDRQTSTQDTGDTGTELPAKDAQPTQEDRKARVEKIVKRMFSGREDQVSEAVEEMLSATERKPDLSAEAIAQQVLQKLKEDREAENQSSAKAAWDARFEEQRREVNELMAGEYQDVNSHPIMREVAIAFFNKARNDPENQGRRLVDMAREAGEKARKITIQEDELARRKAEKQTLPSQSRAAQRAAPAEKKVIPTNSEYIAEMRKRRGLG